MTKAKNIRFILFFLIPLTSYGQIVPVTSNYILNPVCFNPAFSGNKGSLNIGVFYKRQWVEIPNAPSTTTIMFDFAARDERIGLGGVISFDKFGVTAENTFMTNYSFKIRVGGGKLSFGLGAGLMTTNSKWSDLVAVDSGDEDYMIDSKTYAVPQLSVGAYYSYKKFFMGLSVPRLLNFKYNLDENEYDIIYSSELINYMFTSGCGISISERVKLIPSTLISYIQGKKVLYDANIQTVFSDRFWTGLSYRSNNSIIGLMQIGINYQLKIGYSYSYDLNKMGRYGNGSHEIMIRYELNYKVNAVNPLKF